MAHIPKTLQAILEKAAPPELELAFRPMFGGIMGYAAGKVFASLSDVGLALKLSGENHTALLAIEGSKPLQYEPDQPTSKSYVVVPEAMLANAKQLRDWVVRSTMTGDVDLGLQGDANEATQAPLAVIAVDDLEATLAAVEDAGGVITKGIFAFPGGRRFHFTDPNGLEPAALKAG